MKRMRRITGHQNDGTKLSYSSTKLIYNSLILMSNNHGTKLIYTSLNLINDGINLMRNFDESDDESDDMRVISEDITKYASTCSELTELHKAVCKPTLESVKAIIGADINVNIAIVNEPKVSTGVWLLSYFFTIGTTPMHLALSKYEVSEAEEKAIYLERMQMLLTNSAKINIPGNDGLTVYERIQKNPELRSNEDLIENMKNKDSESYIDKAAHNTWLQYGHFIGEFFVSPVIECANEQITTKDEYYKKYVYQHYGFKQGSYNYNYYFAKVSKDPNIAPHNFYECYSNRLDMDHALAALATPAIVLALQGYIAPAYTMLAIKAFEIGVSKQPWQDAFYSGIGYAANVAIAYYLGPIQAVKDNPFLAGVLLPTVGPLMQLSASAINEGYNQLMGALSNEEDEL